MFRYLTRDAVVAGLFGIASLWVSHWLAEGSYYAELQVLNSLVERYPESKEYLRTFFPQINMIIFSLFCGLVFGFPLGVLLRRHYLAYWIVFPCTFLLTQLVASVLGPFGIAIFVSTIEIPSTWLCLGATFLFTLIGHRFRNRCVSPPATSGY